MISENIGAESKRERKRRKGNERYKEREKEERDIYGQTKICEQMEQNSSCEYEKSRANILFV